MHFFEKNVVGWLNKFENMPRWFDYFATVKLTVFLTQ